MSFKISLQALLRIRGITAKEIALKSGLNHSTIQKTITGDRKGREPRKAIANYLKTPYSNLWGVSSVHHIKQLIETAITERAQLVASSEIKQLRKRYLEQSLPATQRVSNG